VTDVELGWPRLNSNVCVQLFTALVRKTYGCAGSTCIAETHCHLCSEYHCNGL